MDVLAGRTHVQKDLFTFILPDSVRLITEDGMFGDNSDVLPAEAAQQGGGMAGSRGAGARSRRGGSEPIMEVELQLDAVIFDDGLCVGPDESDLFDSLTQELDRQRSTAREIVDAMRQGASAGRVFEMLRPLARFNFPGSGSKRAGGNHGHLLHMFANQSIHHLINSNDTDLLAWFERTAQPSKFSLLRPL